MGDRDIVENILSKVPQHFTLEIWPKYDGSNFDHLWQFVWRLLRKDKGVNSTNINIKVCCNGYNPIFLSFDKVAITCAHPPHNSWINEREVFWKIVKKCGEDKNQWHCSFIVDGFRHMIDGKGNIIESIEVDDGAC